MAKPHLGLLESLLWPSVTQLHSSLGSQLKSGPSSLFLLVRWPLQPFVFFQFKPRSSAWGGQQGGWSPAQQVATTWGCGVRPVADRQCSESISGLQDVWGGPVLPSGLPRSPPQPPEGAAGSPGARCSGQPHLGSSNEHSRPLSQETPTVLPQGVRISVNVPFRDGGQVICLGSWRQRWDWHSGSWVPVDPGPRGVAHLVSLRWAHLLCGAPWLCAWRPG